MFVTSLFRRAAGEASPARRGLTAQRRNTPGVGCLDDRSITGQRSSSATAARVAQCKGLVQLGRVEVNATITWRTGIRLVPWLEMSVR